ncbi:MAG: hypothetical protein P8Q35_01610 [Candidatus Thalassarchaeaceae archaeon]|nr:hypothetical protein [Candidatus Thalassarchaeaceae archaeon]PDH22487.1 MAG: hypothetical protein CND29_03950 [Marine Group II euryarchaeote MED-G36]
MDRYEKDGRESPRIDVKTLPDSVVRLWETMLRLDPNWKIDKWLEERADEEMELVEAHLGRERMRLQQRLHRIETLVKRLKRQREVADQALMIDPHQRNLFDVFEETPKAIEGKMSEPVELDEPAVSMGILNGDDDPILAIVAEHILGTIEVAKIEGVLALHFEEINEVLAPMGIVLDEVDEAIAYLLQNNAIIEIEQDFFGLNSP